MMLCALLERGCCLSVGAVEGLVLLKRGCFCWSLGAFVEAWLLFERSRLFMLTDAPFDMAEGEVLEHCDAWCLVLLLKRGCFCWSVAAVWAEPIVHADWCTLWHGRGWSAGTLWCVMLGAFVEAWVLLLKRGCCWCKCCYYVLCWYVSRCRCEAVATMVLCWFFSRCRCVKRGCCWSVVLLEIGLPDW